ncbi:MAG: ferredoxin [Planctomycetota bacterium]|nr:MAG: ferredoxin [Planctomycetota bacterium]
MAKYRIEIDRELCIGDSLCVTEAENTFEMDDEDKAVVINPAGDPDECIKCAAESCPVDAIFLYDAETGEKVWPED